MLEHQETTTGEGFRHGLDELRSKIELLPSQQRPKFRTLVDAAERECEQLQKSCATLRDAVDDLHLVAKYADFHLEASVREIQQVRRQSGLEP